MIEGNLNFKFYNIVIHTLIQTIILTHHYSKLLFQYLKKQNNFIWKSYGTFITMVMQLKSKKREIISTKKLSCS